MASNGCPNGGEPKPGSPDSWVIRNSDVARFASRGGEPGRAFPYGLLDLGLTRDLCGSAPSLYFMSPRFPGDGAAAVYNAYVTSLWNSLCRCKPDNPPPPFDGGQCPVRYRVTSSYSWQDYVAPFQPRSGSNSSVGFGPLTSFRFFQSQGSYDIVGASLRGRDGQNLAGSGNQPVKPGTFRISFTVTRLDGLPDSCGNPPGEGDSLPPPPSPYPEIPVFGLPDPAPAPPCRCPPPLPILPGFGAVPEDPLADLRAFADKLRGLPKLELPRPPWLPKALTDYFNFANLLTWLRFVEPEKDMNEKCCQDIINRLLVLDARTRATDRSVQDIENYVLKLIEQEQSNYQNSKAIALQTYSLLGQTKDLINAVFAFFRPIQVGLNNIFVRQQTYQSENRSALSNNLAATVGVGAAVSAGFLLTARTLALQTVQLTGLGVSVANVLIQLALARSALALAIQLARESIRSDVNSGVERILAAITVTRSEILVTRREAQFYFNSLSSRFAGIINTIANTAEAIITAINIRYSDTLANITAAKRELTRDILAVDFKVSQALTVVNSIASRIQAILSAISDFSKKFDRRVDGLLECLVPDEMKYSGITQIGSGRSGSVALPPRTVAVIFKLSGSFPDNASKRQDGAGQSDVIQGGWCWSSGGGNLGERRPLDAQNKLFTIDKVFLKNSDAKIVWTGANLSSWNVFAAVAPAKKVPPFGERPCQD